MTQHAGGRTAAEPGTTAGCGATGVSGNGRSPETTPDDADLPAEPDGAGESLKTVLLALAANVGVGILKLIAGLITGSGALLSEAAHSVGDSVTEILLLTALRKSDRAADRVHPFGYGKERYFWSLIAAVTILVSGAAFSIYQGLDTLLVGGEKENLIWLNYPVLAVAAVLEGASLRQGLRQVDGEAHKGHRSFRSYLRNPNDPTVKSVVLEDTAAVLGLLFAGLGVALHQITGSDVWDGAASLAIAGLLIVAAFALAQSCKGLLIGRQADDYLLADISRWLEEQPEVLDVVDVLTMMIGVDQILLCARLDFVNSYSVAEVESACVRMDNDLHQTFAGLGEVFLQPVPRTDSGLRQRVLTRYGRVLADDAPDQ